MKINEGRHDIYQRYTLAIYIGYVLYVFMSENVGYVSTNTDLSDVHYDILKRTCDKKQKKQWAILVWNEPQLSNQLKMFCDWLCHVDG